MDLLVLNSGKNAASPLDSDISLPKAPVRVLIVKSREDWQIALECHAFCESRLLLLHRNLKISRFPLLGIGPVKREIEDATGG